VAGSIKKFASEANVKMKKLLAGSSVIVFALLAGTVAQAQDFKGFYVGGNVGGAFSTFSTSTTTVFSPTGYFAMTSPPAIATAGALKLDPNGFNGGGGGGYNFQSGNFVFGFEADWGSMKLSQTKAGGATYPCCAPTAFLVTQSAKTDWLFTARPRVGAVVGRALFYGTAGFAVTNLNYASVFTDTFASALESGGVKENRLGWVAGGGIEIQFSRHLSVKGEYLRADFGTASSVSTNLKAFPSVVPEPTFPQNPFTNSVYLYANIARGGVNFRF